MKWFITPYKSFRFMGGIYTKTLLPPSVKWVFDTLLQFKGSYIGIADDWAFLYIDNQPPIKVKSISIEDVKELCDDIRQYNDMNEYRVSDERKNIILRYYQ